MRVYIILLYLKCSALLVKHVPKPHDGCTMSNLFLYSYIICTRPRFEFRLKFYSNIIITDHRFETENDGIDGVTENSSAIWV